MTAVVFEGAIVASAVAAGITSGITFAFSNFIMRAFARLSEPEAVRAMQAINETVINPTFMAVFMGTGLVMAAIVGGLFFSTGRLDPWLCVGAAIYLGGVVLVTVFANVPLNDTLAAIPPEGATEGTWTRYASPWTNWNHIRAVSAALAAAAFIVATKA